MQSSLVGRKAVVKKPPAGYADWQNEEVEIVGVQAAIPSDDPYESGLWVTVWRPSNDGPSSPGRTLSLGVGGLGIYKA